jgi:hypothetical protein
MKIRICGLYITEVHLCEMQRKGKSMLRKFNRILPRDAAEYFNGQRDAGHGIFKTWATNFTIYEMYKMKSVIGKYLN